MKRLVVVFLILTPWVTRSMEPEEDQQEEKFDLELLGKRFLEGKEEELPVLSPFLSGIVAQELLSKGLRGFILSRVSLPFFEFVGHTDLINALGINSKGDTIVTGSKDGTSRTWNMSSGMPIAILQGIFPQLSQTGDKVMTCFMMGTTRLWNGATGEEIFRGQGPVARLNQAGTHLVMGLPGDETTPKLLDVTTGTIIHSFNDEHSIVIAAFNVAGDKLATGSVAGSVKIWNLISGEEIGRNTVGDSSGVSFLEFNLAGDRVVIGSADGTVRIWNSTTDKTLLIKGHSKTIISASLNSVGDKLVTGSSDGTAKVWNVKTGELLYALEGHEGSISSVSFNPDGDKIITASTDGITRIWDAETGNVLRTLRGQVALFNPMGDTVIVGVGNVARIMHVEPLFKSYEFLAKQISLRQAVILNAIFETMKARGIVKALQEKAFKHGAPILAPTDIVFDFNEYPHLLDDYNRLPQEIKRIFDPYVRRTGF
jgi:WD40 repeat protein